MSVNDEIFDKSVRHAVALEKFKTNQIQDITERLQKDVLDELQQKILRRVELIKSRGFDTGPATTKRLQEMKTAIDREIRSGYSILQDRLKGTLEEVGLTEAEFQAAMLRESTPVDFDFRTPSPGLLRSAINEPFQNARLDKWFGGLSRQIQDGLNKEIFTGLSLGESVPEMTERFRGVHDISKRSMSSVVRTAVNHVTTSARDATYEENSDIISGVQYVSTLDTRTTPICRSLDGKVFPIGEGPRPPQHFNCRSTTVPVLKSFQELGIPAKELSASTRASMNGQVPEKIQYYDWLRKQNSATQTDVLGVKVAELFRKNRLPKVVLFTGQPITLKGLQGGLAVLKPQHKFVLPKKIKVTDTQSALLAHKQGQDTGDKLKKKESLATRTTLCPGDTTVVSERFESQEKWDKWVQSDKRGMWLSAGKWRGVGYKAIKDNQRGDYSVYDKSMFQRDVDNLQKMYDRAPLKEQTLYRGMNLSGDIEKLWTTSGSEIELDSFTSFSTSKNQAATFGTHVFEVKSKRAMDWTSLFEEYSSENEAILPKGVRFRVSKFIDNATSPGGRIILEEIEPEPPKPEVPKVEVKSAPRMSQAEWEAFAKNEDSGFYKAVDSWSGNGWKGIKDAQKGVYHSATIEQRKMELSELQTAYEKTPLFEGQIFRGMKIKEEDIALWTTPESEIELDSWTSFTKKKGKAEVFGVGGHVFSLTTKRGMDISVSPAAYVGEQEVLMPKGSRLRVKSVVGNNVELEEIPQVEQKKVSLPLPASQHLANIGTACG